MAFTFDENGALLISGPISGTGVANRVTYWTGLHTLGSDAGLLVDAANDGYVVADGGYIGNSVATARLVFDSSGGTDYAHFQDCDVGVNTNTPEGKLDIVGSSFPVLKVERTTAVTNSLASGIKLLTVTSGDMSDGFGGGFGFYIEDDAAVEQNPAFIYAERDGADDAGALSLWTRVAAGSITRRFTIKSTGFGGYATADPIGMFDVSYGGVTGVWGADSAAVTRTDATNKYMRFGSAHYTNAEEPVGIAFAFNQAAVNVLYIGGGSASLNATTEIRFYTAANNTTTTGTQQVTIDSAGFTGFNEATPDRRIHAIDDSASTGIIIPIVRLESQVSGGVGAAGHGPSLEFYGETTTTVNQSMGEISVRWSVATHASRRARFELRAAYIGTDVLVGVVEAPATASVDGNARGLGAVDWQGMRSAATQVASGGWSVIGGGTTNTASGVAATVPGGGQ